MVFESKYFKKITAPRYIERLIQECAIKHLAVQDMGGVRDRLDGQFYYENLRNDLLVEFAFEKMLNLEDFDWEKRHAKNYKRKQYILAGKELTLIRFTKTLPPTVNENPPTNVIFCYLKPNLEVYISGLATKNSIYTNSIISKSSSPLNNGMLEFKGFQKLTPFNDVDELSSLLE